MSEIIIETKNLTKTYDDTTALQSLNIKVPKNSIFGFLGPNGAGKTTTMKMLLGQIEPTSGSAMIFGHDIRENVKIHKRIGYLPQDIRFYEHMTAREIISFSMRFFYEGPKVLIDKRVNDMIELVGLENKADRAVKSFSGGERQRLGIAQAEVNQPDLLILDEPASALDPLGRRDVLDLMNRLRKDRTIFYSTHILDDVQRVSDTVAILNKGVLVTQGPIEEILKGGEGTIYTVKLKGIEVEELKTRLLNQSWVSAVSVEQGNVESLWDISISDDSAAEDNLLGLLQGNGGKILDYGQKKVDLEQIFMKLVEGES